MHYVVHLPMINSPTGAKMAAVSRPGLLYGAPWSEQHQACYFDCQDINSGHHRVIN